MKYLLLLCADETTRFVDIAAECAGWAADLGDRYVTAMGLHPNRTRSSLRLSLGRWSTTDDVDQAITALLAAIGDQSP